MCICPLCTAWKLNLRGTRPNPPGGKWDDRVRNREMERGRGSWEGAEDAWPPPSHPSNPSGSPHLLSNPVLFSSSTPLHNPRPLPAYSILGYFPFHADSSSEYPELCWVEFSCLCSLWRLMTHLPSKERKMRLNQFFQRLLHWVPQTLWTAFC